MTLQVLGLILTGVALAEYAGIYWWFNTAFRNVRLWRSVGYLVSHAPTDNCPAWPHVTAGVTLFAGLCLTAGDWLVRSSVVRDPVSARSLTLTAASLCFSVLVSVISFWTLWQTKRIEQIQGDEISTFKGLVGQLGKEIATLNRDFHEHRRHPREHHRVFLVTTNPYLGLLSLKGEDETNVFADQIRRAAENAKESDGGYKCEILCGTEETVAKFNRTHFELKYGKTDKRVEDDTSRKNAETCAFIRELQQKGGTVVRARQIPKTQFAIIGNTVFEFILEAQGYQTEIHRSRRIADKVMCDRFVETFQLLKQLGEQPPPATPRLVAGDVR